MAYYRLEPFGFHADNLNSALIASAITKSNIKNFIFESGWKDVETKKQSVEEMKRIMMSFVRKKKGGIQNG